MKGSLLKMKRKKNNHCHVCEVVRDTQKYIHTQTHHIHILTLKSNRDHSCSKKNMKFHSKTHTVPCSLTQAWHTVGLLINTD